GKNLLPIEVAWFELRRRLIAAIVKHYRRANSLAAVAIDGRQVRSMNAIMFELFVEGLDAHRPNAFGDQVADGIIDHGGGNTRSQPEAIRQIGGDIKFRAADMDLAFRRFAERDDTGVQPVDQSAERQEIQRSLWRNVQPVFH